MFWYKFPFNKKKKIQIRYKIKKEKPHSNVHCSAKRRRNPSSGEGQQTRSKKKKKKEEEDLIGDANVVATCYTGVCSSHAFLLFFLLVFVLAEFLFYSQNVWYIPVRLVRRIPVVPADTIWYRLPWFFSLLSDLHEKSLIFLVRIVFPLSRYRRTYLEGDRQ